MSGHTPWARLRERLNARLAASADVTTVTHVIAFEDDAPWRRPFAVMSIAGHRPTGLADVCGGYLCACRQASWSNLDEYGPYGGCPVGWVDAREFLARYGIPEPIQLPVRDGAE